MTIDNAFTALSKSKFRSSFHLNQKDIDYIDKIGFEKLEKHTEDFIRTRLAPKEILNDGKQTPFKGHPVFIAQHACACCCRGCLNKWYKVPKQVDLSENQQKKIVNLLMCWIKKEYDKNEGCRKN